MRYNRVRSMVYCCFVGDGVSDRMIVRGFVLIQFLELDWYAYTYA